MAKYTKVDETKMKITKEHTTIVEISSLVKAKAEMIQAIEAVKKQLEDMKKRLAVLDEAITEATKLGIDITLKPKPKNFIK